MNFISVPNAFANDMATVVDGTAINADFTAITGGLSNATKDLAVNSIHIGGTDSQTYKLVVDSSAAYNYTLYRAFAESYHPILGLLRSHSNNPGEFTQTINGDIIGDVQFIAIGTGGSGKYGARIQTKQVDDAQYDYCPCNMKLETAGASGNSIENYINTNQLVLDTNSDVYSVPYQDSGASATGWAATPTIVVWYRTLGKMVYLDYQISGTSNSDGCLFSLPYAANSSNIAYAAVAVAINNGVEEAGAFAQISASGTSCSINRLGSAAWTTSGFKGVYGQIFYTRE